MKKLVSLLIVITFFVFIFAACSPDANQFNIFGNSSRGWICFISGQDVWVMRTDGSQMQNITNSAEVLETECKLSWDSKKIVYTDQDNNLYLINRNGTGKRTLLDNGFVQDPSWSPDGTKIIYVQSDLQNNLTPSISIRILDIASGISANLYESSPAYENIPGLVFNPVMSPDGTKIAFAGDGLFVMNADGSKIKHIHKQDNNMAINTLAWSKDGTKLAYSATNGVLYGAPSWAEFSDIYVINADGTGLSNITNNAPDPSMTLEPGKNIFRIDHSPSWTVQNQIVFMSNGDDRSYTNKPFVMKSDGTSRKLLVDQEMDAMDYQQDSKANSTPVPTSFDLSMLPTATPTPRPPLKINTGNSDIYGLAWDGTDFWYIQRTDGSKTGYLHKMDLYGNDLMTIELAGGFVNGLTFDGKNIWYVETNLKKTFKIDPDNGEVLKEFDKLAGWGKITGMAWDGKHLWEVSDEPYRLYLVDPKTCQVITKIRGPIPSTYSGKKPDFDGENTTDLALFGSTWDGHYLWVGVYIQQTPMLIKLDPSIGEVKKEINLENQIEYIGGLAWDGKYLWVADRSGIIYRFEP